MDRWIHLLRYNSPHLTFIQNILLRQTSDANDCVRWSMPPGLFVHEPTPQVCPTTVNYFHFIDLGIASVGDNVVLDLNNISWRGAGSRETFEDIFVCDWGLLRDRGGI